MVLVINERNLVQYNNIFNNDTNLIVGDENLILTIFKIYEMELNIDSHGEKYKNISQTQKKNDTTQI